ncbi:MAG TPA: class I SAM-dependent methyltransferase [Candidatus Sulfomarinibacteraceae bacterium]|nr:class I SAM-dependent methyltransferase [Candidatus Sulfomarinibacteraceae bacterium]
MIEDQGARYDRIAEGYARHWAPVIRAAAVRLLDDLAPLLPPGPTGDATPSAHLLDIGTGTGTLALRAIERWPGVCVTGIDASSEMARFADGEAGRSLPAASRDRFRTTVAFADRLPFADAEFDGAMSSFVLQLVPSRAAALREARRVLRPGAPLGYVTWLLRDDGAVDPPDRIFEEVLDEFGFDPPEPDPGERDPASPMAASNQMRRAGFRDVQARAEVMTHRWTPRGYVDFLEQFSEESLFDELVERERRALRRRLLERLGELAPRDLRFVHPIVYVTGRAAG